MPRPMTAAATALEVAMGMEVMEDRRDALAQASGPAAFAERGQDPKEYDPADYDWGHVLPDHLCAGCFDWVRYPPGVRHLGWTASLKCGGECGCGHHQNALPSSPCTPVG